jgi:uncharacterized protein YqhQ
MNNLSKILLKVADRSGSSNKYRRYRNAAMKIDLFFSPHNVEQKQINQEETYDIMSTRTMIISLVIIGAIAAFGIYLLLPDMINDFKNIQWMVREWEF